jgi:hypothetical protein
MTTESRKEDAVVVVRVYLIFDDLDDTTRR